MERKQYVLAVPNFSEGRDLDKVEKIVDEVRNVPGIKLVSVEPEADFNRTVVTMIGEPAPIKEALVKLGVEEIKAEGETFDPNLHNAVMHVEDDGLGEGQIVEVFQKGYHKGDKVIRHAVVKVAN